MGEKFQVEDKTRPVEKQGKFLLAVLKRWVSEQVVCEQRK